MASMLPEPLDRLAQIQRGVLSLGQLLDGGLSKDVARWQVKARRWRPLHLGVYATFTARRRGTRHCGQPCCARAGARCSATTRRPNCTA